MEFSYAAFRREPPRGLPIWWHAGSSFAVSDMAGVLHALDNDDFDMMVFLKNDRTRVPVVALQHKLSSYDLIGGFSELDVYVRRKASGQS
jgi:predicted dienelactone hydrolase